MARFSTEFCAHVHIPSQQCSFDFEELTCAVPQVSLEVQSPQSGQQAHGRQRGEPVVAQIQHLKALEGLQGALLNRGNAITFQIQTYK